MSALTSQPTRPRRGQDPAIRGNPYAALFLRAHGESDDYLVQSASSEDAYLTSLHRDDPDRDRCSCPARGHCHHIDSARLMRQIERVTANAETYYRGWGLLALQAEEQRMMQELRDADSWLLRSQIGVIGDAILARLTESEAA